MNDKSITIDKNNDLEYSGFKLHKTGLEAIGEPNYDQWQECGRFIQKASGSVSLWLGDWLNYGEKKWGEKYAQAIEETGMEYGSLRNAAYTAGKIGLSDRSDKLGYKAHELVAPLNPELQREVLRWAEQEQATVKEVKNKIREVKNEAKFLNITTTGEIKGELIHGDCLSELPKIADQSIDLIYIDPPYNVSKDAWDTMTVDDFYELITQSITQSLRVLKPDSHLFIHFPAQKTSWLEDLILTKFNLMPSSRVIWHYRNLVMGRDSSTKFLNTYQPMLHYSFGNKPLNFNPEWNDERFDVWTMATPQSNFEEGKVHITQKPLELLERVVELGSLPGEMVLDFFAGSGTTGVAAQKLKRNYILIEKEERYIDVIRQRLTTI